MESLALLAAIIVLAIYLSALVAFGLSWLRNSAGRVLTLIFATVGIVTGIWIWATLASGNGMFIGSIPIVISLFSVWNTLRRNKPKA